MVLVQPPRGLIGQARLRRTFGLTQAEARLLSALLTGERLRLYAERTGIKMSTAKTHLRNLFCKTGESRQIDLVRRVNNHALLQRLGD